MLPAESIPPTDNGLQAAQLEKLRLEIEDLRRNKPWSGRLTDWVPIITALIAVAGFLLGIVQTNKAREKEFKKVFWERQLQTYGTASRLAAEMSTTSDHQKRDVAYAQFQEIYHGEMVLVEDVEVKDAMKHFIEVFIDYRDDPGLQDEVEAAARALARKCRKSIAKTWDVDLQDLDTSTF